MYTKNKRIFTSVPVEINNFFHFYLDDAKPSILDHHTRTGKEAFLYTHLKLWLINPSYYEYPLTEAEKIRLSKLPHPKNNISISLIDERTYKLLLEKPDSIATSFRNYCYALYAFLRDLYN
jgi:hypothetical protein